MRLLRRHFGILLGSTALAACQTTSATLERLKAPASMVELLVNVREVTLSGLILREDFYTEDNLKRVFGGSTVKLGRIAMDESVQIGADVGGFPPWPGMRPAANSGLTLRVSRYKGYLSDGRPVGFVTIRNDEASDVKFEAIERVFGRNWVKAVYVPFVPPHGPIPSPPPATHPMGHETVTFQLGRAGLDRKVEVRFERDGTFATLEASADKSYEKAFPASSVR
jgi:hypothetical protein